MQLTDAQFRVAVVENEKIVQVTQPVDFFTGSRVAKKTVELGLARFTVRRPKTPSCSVITPPLIWVASIA